MTGVDNRAQGARAAEVLTGGGEMGALMRAHDWAATPLGPIEGWPRSLVTAVTLILESRYPMMVMWGADFIQFYNDAYRPVLGASKHPQALGRPGAATWPEAWDVIGPLFRSVRESGEAIWMDDLLLLVDRYGYLEETHFAFSYSPIRDEAGGVGGVLVTCTETTERVLGERRLRTLRALAARTAEAKSAEDVCTVAAATLAENAADVPFALLYLLDDAGTGVRLAAATGLEAGLTASPWRVDLGGTEEETAARWPLARAVSTRRAALVDDLPSRFGALTIQPDATAPTAALILPVAQAAQERPTALLVAGISPRRALDDGYRGFFDLVGGQIATAIANARAYEEERRRAEALAELDRAKTAFFGNVSHEFRTPLTLLLGPLEEALAAPPETPLGTERAQLEIAHRNSLRLLRLVNTLLDFSRIEAGRAQASYEPTDLAAYTADLAGVFRSAVERAGLDLVVDCPPLPASVYVDREMWEKIVLNLLSNAFKFTFRGEIAVVLRAHDERVTLEVRDTGTGIPAEELPHLFERFHRVRGARARTHEGTGIGLALVRELVMLHGGTIDAQSVVDGGTTFTVTLPLGAAHLPAERIGAARTLASTALGAAPYVEEVLRWLPGADPAETLAPERPVTEMAPSGARLPAEDAPAEAGTAGRVLLADDNADMRAYVCRLLGARYAVEAVANGSEALAAVQARPPDLVLADVMMPELDGFALLRALRADPRTRTLPVILLSARTGEEATEEGLQAGADDYLVKPFAASELLARVQAHLALARLRQEAIALVAGQKRVFEMIATGAALADVLSAVARVIEEQCDGLLCTILVRDPEHEQFALGIAPGLPESYIGALAHASITPPYLGPCGQAAHRGEEVIAADIATDERWAQEWRDLAVRHGLRTCYSTPILAADGRILGSCGMYYRELRDPKPANPQVIATATYLAGIAVERRQTEEALRASHDHLQLALTAARMVAWEWDPHADVVTTSENLAEVYGVARLDASTQGFPLVHPDDRARHEATVRQAAETAGGYASTFRITRPDTGAVVWLEERAAAVMDATGALQKLTGVVMDVSARARGEAELRRQAALLALAHDAIIVRDPRGSIITWSDGATALYGWTAVEAVGRTMHDLLRTRVLPAGGPGTETDDALAAHGAWEGELEHTRRDGTRVVVESRQALLRAADGTPEAILEVNRDIAPRLELAAALARLQTLQAVSDTALAQLTLPALLRQVLTQITAALAVDNTAILLLDETEQTLIVHHALGPEEAQTGQLRVPMGQGVAGRIAATRQPLIVADLRSAEPVNPLLREQMASLMGVPLLVEGRLLGVMHVDSATPRRFTDDELHLLQLVADRVALALDNARLYRDALEARDQIARLQRVTAALAGAVTAEEVADVIIKHGLAALEAASGAVALLADDGASFTTVRSAGYPSEALAAWSVFSAADDIPIADAVRAREPVILESRAEHDARYPHLAGIYAADTDGALVAIPLLLGDRAIGGLGLRFPTTRRFSGDERAMMGALGELCAQALERARLHEAERTAHAASEAERDRWRQVLDVLPVGVVIVDGEGRVEVLNRSGREIVGLDTRGQRLPAAGEEARDGYRVRRPDGSPYPPQQVPLRRSLLHGEEVRDDQQVHRHAVTGRETPLLVNSAPLRDVEERIVGAVATFQDITPIQELERARDEFLSSAAHDLKTPLTGIRGQAQLAQRRLARLDLPETAPVLGQLARIQDGTDTLLSLINELVDVTRQQMGGGLELHREPSDLVALVRDCVEMHRDESGRVIHLEADAPELHADVDATRVGRVVGNLLSNALKYSPAESAITVRLSQENGAAGPEAVLVVHDEGLGIPAADLPHIFDRFARAGNVAGHIQGTGIGLASARGIVEQHGGTITAESIEGQGSTFTVRLPLALS